MRLNERGHSSELQILIFIVICGVAVGFPFARGHQGLWHGLKMALLALPLGLAGLAAAILLSAKPAELLGEGNNLLSRGLGFIIGLVGLAAAIALPMRFAQASLHDPGGAEARFLTYLSIALWIAGLGGGAVMRWRYVVAARKARASKAS